MNESSRLTTAEIARWTGITPEGIRQRFRSGALAGEIINNVWTANEHDVAALWPARVAGREPPRLRLVQGGPQTQVGKRSSSVNASRHGLFAKATVSAALGELPEEYGQVRQAYVEAFDPKTALEVLLVEQLVAVAWRRLRALRATNAEAVKAWRAAQSPERLQITKRLDQLSANLGRLAASRPGRGDVDAWARRASKLFCALHPAWVEAGNSDPTATDEGGQVFEMMWACEAWKSLLAFDGPPEMTTGPIAEVTGRLRRWVAALSDRVSCGDDGMSPARQSDVPRIDPEHQQTLDAHEHHLDRRHAALLAELRAVRGAGAPAV